MDELCGDYTLLGVPVLPETAASEWHIQAVADVGVSDDSTAHWSVASV